MTDQDLIGFLHRHPGKEAELNLDPDHVIVDKKNWERARKESIYYPLLLIDKCPDKEL